MSTTLTEVTPTTSAPTRRPRRTWLVAGTAVVVVALGSTVAYAVGYQPLAPGNLTNSGPATTSQGVGDNRDVFALPFAPGAEQTLQFTVANTGRWTVTSMAWRCRPSPPCSVSRGVRRTS